MRDFHLNVQMSTSSLKCYYLYERRLRACGRQLSLACRNTFKSFKPSFSFGLLVLAHHSRLREISCRGLVGGTGARRIEFPEERLGLI